MRCLLPAGMDWGTFPRLARKGMSARDSICMDTAAYSLPGDGTDNAKFIKRISGDIAMGVRMYRRPGQKMLVMCSSKIPGNVVHVAQALSALSHDTRRHIRVLIHDGIYNNAKCNTRRDSHTSIALTCESAWLAFKKAGIGDVEVGYVFSRAHSRTDELCAQLRAIYSAHAAGQIQFVGLATPRAADFTASLRTLLANEVPVQYVVVHPSSYADVICSAATRDDAAKLLPLTYDARLARHMGATHISASRHGYVHMQNWASAVFNQPTFPPADLPVL